MIPPEMLGAGYDRAPENGNDLVRYSIVNRVTPIGDRAPEKEHNVRAGALHAVTLPAKLPTTGTEVKNDFDLDELKIVVEEPNKNDFDLDELKMVVKEPNKNDSDLDELMIVVEEPKRSIYTRLFSLVVLAAVVAFFALGVRSAYQAFTDSFIAPLILSPDSEIVIQSKLNLSRLLSEREQLLAKIDEGTASIAAAERAIAMLKELQSASSRSGHELDEADTSVQQRLDTTSTTGRKELLAVLQRQKKYVADLENDLAAGLIHEADLVREQNTLNHIRVALFQDKRENFSAQTQLTQIELDLLKNEAERRAQIAQRRATQEELTRLDDLLAQLRQRPIFRAVDASQTLGFVPYSQIEGIYRGAEVYRCSLWGVFGCTRVGAIAEIVPGEVVAQDPWGSTARGEYVILDLTDKTAAQSKSLRVRGTGEKSPADRMPTIMSAR